MEAPRVPPVEVWAEVQVASKVRAGHPRLERRRREAAVVRRARRERPREAAQSALVRARQELALARVAVWEPKAAQPAACWRAGSSRASSAVECPWADRRRQPWWRRSRVCHYQRRPAGRPDCLQSRRLGLEVDDIGELGLLIPGEPDGPLGPDPPPRPGAAGAGAAGEAGPAGEEGTGPAAGGEAAGRG